MINYKIPENIYSEIDQLEKLIYDYRQGKIQAGQIKAFRVPFGVYEQRQNDFYMIRLRCAAGIITPLQLKMLGIIAKEYDNRRIHLTTRQEVQIHDLSLEQIPELLKKFIKLGLSSRGGGGNTVRNIIADTLSGIHPDSVFDVTPYAIALTTRLIAESDSWTLPRKYKIAFSASNRDRGHATVSDLGFIATIKNNQKGFRVFATGGLGAHSEPGFLLYDFIPANEIYALAEAIKSVFHQHGNRRNKYRARLRFLRKDLGTDRLVALIDKQFRRLKQNRENLIDQTELPVFRNNHSNISIGEDVSCEIDGYNLWKSRHTTPQTEPTLSSVILPVALGDVDAKTCILLGDFLEKFGENVIRLSHRQNFVLRNLPEKALPALFRLAKENFPLVSKAPVIGRIRSCAGASTCRLGICLSRGLASALSSSLSSLDNDILDAITDLNINISGCPNNCGQHVLADIGFYGYAGRKNGRLYPAYHILVGATRNETGATLAHKVASLPARQIPEFIKKLIKVIVSKHQPKTPLKEALASLSDNEIREIAKPFTDIPDFENDKNPYFDFGADEVFSLAGRGVGECSAGLFDLIDIDREKISELQKQYRDDKNTALLSEMLYHATRMLLITRGVEALNRHDVFQAFIREFIRTGLVPESYSTLIEDALNNKTPDKERTFALCKHMEKLYQNMDDSLQFKIKIDTQTDKEPIEKSGNRKRHFKDLGGVKCPMNFVKVKIELSRLQAGDILEVRLDDGDPIENVPDSVKNEGHGILEQKQLPDGQWSLLIQKKGE